MIQKKLYNQNQLSFLFHGRGIIVSGKWTPISLSSDDESTDANDKQLQLEGK